MSGGSHQIAVIGGGIVGLAAATALGRLVRPSGLIVLEAERAVGMHQTGHNSGVIHSGLYYKPGSLKASNCVEGREALYRFCAEHGIPHERCGKLVVATTESELPALEELERRGRANGLQGLRSVGPSETREIEPHVRAIAALRVAETGIVDFGAVARRLAELLLEAGATIHTAARVIGIRRDGREIVLETHAGAFRARHLVNCGGLHSDRIARMCGIDPGLRIIPFRGEYYELVPERRSLVRNLVYPVPDPRFPFLGVHFTRGIHGGVEAGPNAVLALKREGYRKSSVSAKDALEMLAYGGFWRMAGRYWRMGLGELHRSLRKQAFVDALRRLVPEIRPEDLRPAGAGVRAQAVERSGILVDDFRIVERESMIHVLNAPSPAATASLAIGGRIAARARETFGLQAVPR